MALLDINIKRAKPTGKPQRMFDGGGLYLEIASSPKGTECLGCAGNGVSRRIQTGAAKTGPKAGSGMEGAGEAAPKHGGPVRAGAAFYASLPTSVLRS